MLKLLLRWLLGGQRKLDGKQHVFRQPGQVASDEEIEVSYEPGWWQSTGTHIAKTLGVITMVCCLIAAAFVAGDWAFDVKDADVDRIQSEKAANLDKIAAEKEANVDKAKAFTKAAAAKAKESKAMKERLDVEAENARAVAPCVDFIKIVKEDKNGAASVRCTHTTQVMSTTWEGGRFIVTCKCPAKQ